MKAQEAKLLGLLNGSKQFSVPTYQRTYSWTEKHCQQLWSDIMKVGNNSLSSSHFIGSIVYILDPSPLLGGIWKASVIDGQQRITTCSLLLKALVDVLKERDDALGKNIEETYLLNINQNGDQRYKLIPTTLDKEKYIGVLNGDFDENDTSNIIVNYLYFKKKILDNIDKLDIINSGISKLSIIDTSLDITQDNPQLIFESMNSTGLELTKAELIKNYLLMGIPTEEQELLYKRYWYPIDSTLENSPNTYDYFFRDYLTYKSESGAIPNLKLIYEKFKEFVTDYYEKGGNTEGILSDILNAFKHYEKFLFVEKENSLKIRNCLDGLDRIEASVAYPFMLEVFDDYDQGIIDEECLVKILNLVESYIFRRYICGLFSNTLNKTFSTLKKYLDKTSKEAYYESFCVYLNTLEGNYSFPNDEQFEAGLLVKDIYSNASRCKYLLENLENYDKKEKIQISNYTIEHIMPQNTINNTAWQMELGDNWEIIYDKYINTLGNLTLTGYNSEYSDRPFIEKKNLNGKGFNDSPVTLNSMLKYKDVWNEESIIERAKILTGIAKKIWGYDKMSNDIIGKYKVSPKKFSYTYDDHKYLEGHTRVLFDGLKEKLLALDIGVKEEVTKLYIAFKYDTNFVDIEPQRRGLRLTLNMDFDDIKDPNGICRDITHTGAWGNGNVSVTYENEKDLDYIMFLIKQSFDQQYNGNSNLQTTLF